MKSQLMNIDSALAALEEDMLQQSKNFSIQIQQLHPMQQLGANNLIKYLVLRGKDRRALQESLHIFGLSSLTSSESHIHSQVQAVRQRLGHRYNEDQLSLNTFTSSKINLEKNSLSLFGPKTTPNLPTIMVTFDSGFASDYQLIEDLLKNGMNVARINCAHDDEATWSEMIQLIKKASIQTGKECKVYMDLAGPKIRTKLLGKGREKGKVKVREEELIWLAEASMDLNTMEVIISPTETGIIRQLKTGDRVFIDDGTISGVVENKDTERAAVRIKRVSSKKGKIKENKGINFPDTKLDIPSLTAFDLTCLPFVCQNADLIGYSFVKEPSDITFLRDKMSELSCEDMPIILKIETKAAVSNFPALILEGMKSKKLGVMIARGDLAVEIGFERMGEIQEEILWICESAHVPVIWATQVMESMHKSGMPTRSEITDAGHASLAECIMINKGKHTIEVMKSLKTIIQSAASHRIKKRFTFRPLNIASDFLS